MERAQRLLKPNVFPSAMLSLYVSYVYMFPMATTHGTLYAPHTIQPQLNLHLRLVQNLEAACEILEKQYEVCDGVRLDTAQLQTKGIGEHAASEFLDSLPLIMSLKMMCSDSFFDLIFPVP